MSLQTSAAFRQYYMDGRAPLVRAVLRLADDTTVQVGGDRIMNGGLSVTGATSPASDFSIGSAIVGTATVTLANYDGWLDLIDLEGATLLAYAGAEVTGGTEWALLGTYDVDAPTTRGMTCPVQCRDWMGRFEVPYGDVSTVYPATLATIVSDICTHVGITLSTPTFPNSTHVVQTRPTDELSCIDMLGFVAQLACSFARMTPDGQLALGWYDPDAFGGDESWLDGGTFAGTQTPYADGDTANGGAFMTGGDTASGGTFADAGDYANVSAIRSLTVGAMDVTITGLRVTAQDEQVTEGEGAEGESYQYGQDGYVLVIENNPLIPYGTAQAVAGLIAPHVVGLSFRTVEADVIGDPSLVAGDAMVVTDRLGRTYRTYVTQATWSSGGSQRLACGAQAPSRRAMSRTGVVTRAISSVKGAVRRVTTATQAARQVADEAKSVADAIGQHFWTGDDGVHVTQITQESWETSPAGPNLLANSLGILLRTGLSNLVSVTQSAIAFYDGLGNADSNFVAQFGRSLARVGGELGSHLDVTEVGMGLYGESGEGSFLVGPSGVTKQIDYGNRLRPTSFGIEFDNSYQCILGSYLLRYNPRGHTEFGTGWGVSVSVNKASYDLSFAGIDAHSDNVTATLTHGADEDVVDMTIVPTGEVLDGWECEASVRVATIRPSIPNVAYKPFTLTVIARAEYMDDAHEYLQVTFSMRFDVAPSYPSTHESIDFVSQSFEITRVITDDVPFLSFGTRMGAIGGLSATFGEGLIASALRQFAAGRWNNPDSGNYALMVGNGSDDSSRSNALAVDWDGGLYLANHVGPIGETKAANATVSVQSGTGTALCSVTIAPGTWVIEGNVGFARNATGRRIVTLSTTAGNTTNASILSQTGVEVPAVSGGYTALHTGWITTRSSATTVYLNVWQNSGGDLSATGYIRAVRIA